MLTTENVVDISTMSFFQHLLNQLDSLVFVKDDKGQIVYVNEAFELFINKPLSDYLGKKIEGIFESKDHFNRADRQDQEVLNAPEGYTLQSIEHYDARPGVYMLLTKRKFVYNEKPYLIGLLVDVSDLKNSEQKLKTSHQQLEKKIDQIQQTETKLIESEKMASIGHLAAGLAHEIGNPINYVAGSVVPIKRDVDELKSQLATLKMAREQQDMQAVNQILDYMLSSSFLSTLDETSQLLFHIEEGSDRVKNLLESLKSFSNQSEAATSLTDINQVINQTLKLMSHTIGPGVSLATMLSEELPKVYTNAGQLAQVLMHLVKNAFESLKGYGRVLIKSSLLGEKIQIEVIDSGIGMSQETKRKIFEPFYTTKDVGTGVGLGLSISLNIINQLGGNLKVESVVGKGTTVTVCLTSDL